MSWGDQSTCLFCATARFFRPGYKANLIDHWLPSLDGIIEKLQRGAKVADVGCGHGVSTVIMAQAFPNSQFIGYDFHPSSIEHAQGNAREGGVSANTHFEVATAKDYPGKDFDLVAFFDCLHDMGDPVGAAAHVRQSLENDGTWMITEPMAGDRLEDNLNPIGRLFYGGSTMVCVPTSLAQEVGAALGGQAGEAKLRRGHYRRGLRPRPAHARNSIQHGSGGASVANARGRPVNALTFLSNAGRKQSPFHPPPATCAFVVGGGRPTLRQRGSRPTRRRAVVALAGITDRNVRCNPVANPASPESGQSRKQYRPQAASASGRSDVRCDQASSLLTPPRHKCAPALAQRRQ